MQFCGEPGCGVLVARGRCAVHASRYARDAVYAATHAWYGTQAWQRLRMHLLCEQPFCRVCRAAGRNVVATDIDHIVRHNGDRRLFWDVANLQPLCKGCHHAKTMRGE